MTRAKSPAAAGDTAAVDPVAAEPAAPPVVINQDEMSLKDLARGVLAREFRPRVSSIRRLAEAVLEPKKKKAKGKKAKAGGKAEGKGTRKLARIPKNR